MAESPKTLTDPLVETPPVRASAAASNGAGQSTDLPVQTPSTRRSGVRRGVVLPIAAVAVAVAVYFGYNYWRANQLFVSTDDALVDSNLVGIAAPASGTLTNWRVKPGDRVRAGQVIGAVRTPPAGVNLATINIIAPEDGTILKVDGKEGQVIGVAQAIAYMADLNALTITAYINENDIHRLRLGQVVDVTVEGSGGAQYTGTVSEVIPAAASQFALIQTQDRGSGNFTKVTQRIEVHISLGDTGGTDLYPGMNAKVRIHVR